MTARLLDLAYRLRRHRLGDWTLERWGVMLAWGATLVILAQWLVRGRPALPPWHWVILALLLLGGLTLKGLGFWAARRSFVSFAPQPDLVAPAPAALPPEEKILLHATGIFEVQSKTRFSVNLLAYWRTYASREHAILAIEHPSRSSSRARLKKLRGCGTSSSGPKTSCQSGPAGSATAAAPPPPCGSSTATIRPPSKASARRSLSLRQPIWLSRMRQRASAYGAICWRMTRSGARKAESNCLIGHQLSAIPTYTTHSGASFSAR